MTKDSIQCPKNASQNDDQMLHLPANNHRKGNANDANQCAMLIIMTTLYNHELPDLAQTPAFSIFLTSATQHLEIVTTVVGG